MSAIFLFSSVVAESKQVSKAVTPSSAGETNSSSTDPERNCASNTTSPNQPVRATDREPSPIPPTPAPVDGTRFADATLASVHLDEDMKLIDQKRAELAQCIVTLDPQASAQDLQGACSGQLLLNFEMRHNGDQERIVPIGRLPGTGAFFYESEMTIDADGAPNAYDPENTGLDDLVNAGTPGRWEGLAKDPNGEPYIQGPDDPYPGYYVSSTALADRSKAPSDPRRYVDASRIPFVVLPGGMARELGARPGDFAAVFNARNGKSSFAIFADVGPFDHIGEGSVALAENLGIRSDARNGGTRGGILFLVFPGSGDGAPRTIEEINAEGEKLLMGWEQSIARGACTVPQAARAADAEPGRKLNPAAN